MSLSIICKEAVLSNDSGIGCTIVDMDQKQEVASFLRDPGKAPLLRSFVATALSLLGDEGQKILSEFDGASPQGGEVHLAGEVLGYARLLPARRLVIALLVEPSLNVGVGWATLSVTASRLENLLPSGRWGLCFPAVDLLGFGESQRLGVCWIAPKTGPRRGLS